MKNECVCVHFSKPDYTSVLSHNSAITASTPSTSNDPLHVQLPSVAATSLTEEEATTSNKDKTIDRSFEQILCDHFTPLTRVDTADPLKPPVRRRINPMAEVLTMDDFTEKIREAEALRLARLPNWKKRKIQEAEELESEDEDLMTMPSVEEENEPDNSTSSEEDAVADGGMVVPTFNIKHYKSLKANLKVQKYYIVSYGQGLAYVGRIVSLGKEKVVFKFLQRKPNDEYTWPRKDQIEEVMPKQIVCAVSLKGSWPFKILGVAKVAKEYVTFMKKSD